MSTHGLPPRPGLAVASGSDALRRWAADNERRAMAVAAYFTAVVVMLVLVISPVAGHDAPATQATSATAAHVPDYYTVREGDTLAGIAAEFGLTVQDLRALNARVDPMTLAPGTKLRLRESAAAAPTESPAAKTGRGAVERKAEQPAVSGTATKVERPALSGTPTKPARPAPAPEPPSGRTHTVASGETLTSIAAGYGTTVDELLALNPGIDPYSLVAGQEVAVP